MPNHRPKPYHKDADTQRRLVDQWEKEIVPESEPTSTNPFINDRIRKEGRKKYPPESKPTLEPLSEELSTNKESSGFVQDPPKSPDVAETSYREQALNSGQQWDEQSRKYEPTPKSIDNRRPAARRERELDYQIEDIKNTAEYTKLAKIQALIKYAEHIYSDEKIWGKSGSKITTRDPYYPQRGGSFFTPEGKERASVHSFSSSFIAMRNFFKEHSNWDDDKLKILRDYSNEGAREIQKQYLSELGFLKKVNPRWVDMYPNNIKPMFGNNVYMKKLFPVGGPDGEVEGNLEQDSISELSEEGTTLSQKSRLLPKLKVTMRKETSKTPIGIYTDPSKTNYGNTKFMKRTKYYKLEHDYLVTDVGKDYVTKRFQQNTSDAGFAGQKVLQITDKNFVLDAPESIEDKSTEVESVAPHKEVQKPMPLKSSPILEGRSKRSSAVPGTSKPTNPLGGGSSGGMPRLKPPKYERGGFVTL